MKGKKHISLTALLLCAAMLLAVLAGCGGNNNPSSSNNPGSSSSQPEKKDTLVVASQTEPTSLCTVDHNALASDYVNQIIYSGLVRVNENNEVVPDVAESWEQPSDTEWIFHLRQDVYFHNGEHLTAADVVATLEWAKGFEPVSAFTLTFATAIEAVDEYTVRIVTEEPVAALLYNLTNHAAFLVPKSLIDSGHDFNAEPIGCGPYKFVSRDAGEKLVFEAFDKFYEGEPAIKNLIYMVIPESASRTVALQSGDVDYVIQVSAADYDMLVADDSIETLSIPGNTLNYIMVNNAAAPFNDLYFRKAVNAAINKQDIVDGVLYGLATVATTAAPAGLSGVSTANADAYSVELAKEYLAKSSVTDYSFTVLCSNDTKVKEAEVIKGCLAEVGIDMKIESCDTSAYLSRTGVGDYQAAIGGYSHSSAFTFCNYNYLSAAAGGSSRSQAAYDEIDSMLAAASTKVDAAEHKAALEELTAVLNDMCIGIPLFTDNNVRAYNKDLGGVIVNGSNENNWRTFYWKTN